MSNKSGKAERASRRCKRIAIARSAGIIPRVNRVVVACYPLPGGGYEGRTRRLDRVVASAARWLRNRFGLPLVIRFNSDSRSGGAWLVDPAHDDAGVGLCAQLKIPMAIRHRWAAWPPPRLVDIWTPDEKTGLAYALYLQRDFFDGGDYGSGNRERGYGYWEFSTLAAAQAALMKSVDRGKLKAIRQEAFNEC